MRPVKTEWWGAGMVICLEQGADLHVAQLMPLPLTISCFVKIQIDFFTVGCFASAVLAVGLCPCLSVSVCLSQAGVLLKRQNVGSQKQHHMIPQGL